MMTYDDNDYMMAMTTMSMMTMMKSTNDDVYIVQLAPKLFTFSETGHLQTNSEV